jgi:hypothetical protein
MELLSRPHMVKAGSLPNKTAELSHYKTEHRTTEWSYNINERHFQQFTVYLKFQGKH